MSFFYIRITREVRAPKPTSKNLMFKTFKAGQKVEVEEYNQSNSPLNYVPVYRTKDGFIIPQMNAMQISHAEPAHSANEGFEEALVVTPETPQVNVPVKSAAEIKTNVTKQMNFAMVGGGIALAYAAFTNKNKLMFAIGGLAAGYLIAKAINKTQNAQNNV